MKEGTEHIWLKRKLFEVVGELYSWLERSRLLKVGDNLKIGAIASRRYFEDRSYCKSGLFQVGDNLKIGAIASRSYLYRLIYSRGYAEKESKFQTYLEGKKLNR